MHSKIDDYSRANIHMHIRTHTHTQEFLDEEVEEKPKEWALTADKEVTFEPIPDSQLGHCI